jgi:CrcB protein
MTASPPHPLPRPALLVGVLATGAGGAVGAVARWSATSVLPVEADRFPWATFVINLVGAALLAALPLLAAVHTRPWLSLLLGTGVLGGFTTMSAASAETFELLDHGHVVLGLAYCLGTLGAALVAVTFLDRVATVDQRVDVDEHEGYR